MKMQWRTNFFLAQKYLDKSTKMKQQSIENHINREEFHKFSRLKEQVSKEHYKCYEIFQYQLISSTKSSREKWNLINEARNKNKTKICINIMKNCFGDHITDPVKIANFLNFKFSDLGDFFQKTNTYNDEGKQTSKSFSFRFCF